MRIPLRYCMIACCVAAVAAVPAMGQIVVQPTGPPSTIAGGTISVDVYLDAASPFTLRGYQLVVPCSASGGGGGSLDYVPVSTMINPAFALDMVFAVCAINGACSMATAIDQGNCGISLSPRIANAPGSAGDSALVGGGASYCIGFVPPPVDPMFGVPCVDDALCLAGGFGATCHTLIYMGSFDYIASNAPDPVAAGTFTICMVPDPGTKLGDEFDAGIAHTPGCMDVFIADCTIDSDCDDGDKCTVDTCVAPGNCDNSVAVTCDDGNVCTDDSCDTATGCVNADNSDACDDGDACTENDACLGGACGGSTVDCDDGDDCTNDSCNPATGCVFTKKESEHFVDETLAGFDNFGSTGVIGVDWNLDEEVDVTLVLCGDVHVERTGPLDDSFSFPGLAPVDGHHDVIDTYLSMTLTGGGVTLTVGAGQGRNPNLPPGYLLPSPGAIVELSDNPALAHNFFHVFFEIEADLGNGLMYLYNQSVGGLEAQGTYQVKEPINCIPPPKETEYNYVTAPGQSVLPLFTSPVPGQGLHVANLIFAQHSVDGNLGACCDMTTGTCIDCFGETECMGPQQQWSKNAQCIEVACEEHRGACCVQGACTDDVPESECQSEKWLKGTLCSDQDAAEICEDQIPTLSSWGSFLLALLLLTAIAIKFGRRRPARPSL